MLPSSLKFLWIRLSYTVQSFCFCLTKFCLHKIPAGKLLFNMKNKSLKRIENKKKKMAALLEISQLNEYDRNLKKLHSNGDGSNISESELEPSVKKARTESPTSEHNEGQSNFEQKELGSSGKPKLTGLEFQELKRMLREKTTKLRQQPVFKLRDMGVNASLTTDLDNRVPLFLSDIQHLIMYSQLGHHSPYSPARWCALEKFNRLSTTCVLIIENVTLHHFNAHESMFPFISTFENKLEILAPNLKSSDVVKELSMVPLTGTQVKRFCDQFGTLQEAVLKSAEVFDTVRNLFPIERDDNVNNQTTDGLPSTDRFPRTQLLLSGWQMVEENFPLPIKGLMESKYSGYILTKDKYQDVTPSSRMFGIDCEMCKTTSGELELTRVSVVDEEFNVFYDTLVKPENKITDYLTRFSGITHKMMKNIKTTLKDVQEDLRRLLPPDAILVGQSLGNDLHALKMMHPYVIDTSVIYNITGDRSRKTKLKTLSREFLSERIQEGNVGHCSTEDSIASLKLAQLKLTKNLYFGDAVMGNIHNDFRACPDLGTFNYATSMLKQTTKLDKTALVIGHNDVTSKYKFYVDKGIKLQEENGKIRYFSEKCCKDVVKKMCDSVNICSLCIGHMRIQDDQLDGTKTFKNIDRWVKEICERMSAPGLAVVVFSGCERSNGSCFIHLKRDL